MIPLTITAALCAALAITSFVYSLRRCRRSTQLAFEAEEKYRSLFVGMIDAFARHKILLDSSGKPCDYVFLEVNHAFERITGLSQVEGRRVTDVLPESTAHNEARIEQYGKLALEGGSLQFEDYSERTKRWFSIRAHSSKKGYFTCIFEDITKRKEAEKALEESHSRLVTVMNSMDAIVYAADMDSHEVLFINEYGRSLWGDIVGSRCWETIQADQDGPCPFCTNDQLLTDEGLPTEGVRWEHQNTSNGKWYDCRDQAIEWIDGRLVRLEISIDVTDRVNTEKQLKEQTKELKRLYSKLGEELESARFVYDQLLQTPTVQIPGISVTSFAKPATYIGGDFVSMMRKSDKLVVCLADITGHGLDGAMFSTLAKESIESYISLTAETVLSPDGVLKHLDRRMRETLRGDEYAIAMFLVIVDIHTLDASYAGAGFQNPPIVIRSDGSQQLLISEGLPITTAVPDSVVQFECKHTTFDEGSKIVLATDGLYEQFDSESTMYEQRFLRLLDTRSHYPPQALLDALWNDFQDHAGSVTQADDVTAVVVQFDHDRDTLELVLPSSFRSLDLVREHVLDYYSQRNDVRNIAMGVHELATNAMEHGNRFVMEKSVHLHLMPKAIAIIDGGHGFDWRHQMSKTMDVLDAEQGDRGRGVHLTNRLVGELVYNETGNRVTLVLAEKNPPHLN